MNKNDTTLVKDLKLSESKRIELLGNLDELKKNSDPMSTSEFIKEYTSTFEEAFPELRESKSHQIFLELSKDNYNFGESTESYNSQSAQNLLRYISDNQGEKLSDLSVLENFLFKDNKVFEVIQKVKSELDISDSNDDWINISDEKIIIDWKKTILIGNRLIKFAIENREIIKETLTYSPFIGTYFIYRNIVSSYDKAIELDNKNYPRKEKELLYIERNRSMRVFRIQAVLIALSLSSISSVTLRHGSTKIIDHLIKGSDSNVSNSYIFLILTKISKKFKDSIFLKYIFIILILFIFIIFITIIFNYLMSNPNKILLCLKFIVIFSSSLFINFYLFKLYYLIKYRSLNTEDIHISENLPKFLQITLLNIKDISKFNNYKMFAELYIKTIIYMFSLFLLFIVITSFLSL
uniref:plasmid hypothetical protein 2 n=1 Tax=Moniliophthora perniciosa TaxID=153609 RepID=UPI000024236F|nr:plasmid hypothetical protein 2 [Moniliophthora perniciosa]AAQ74289.1 plasmid hypothetical protein 2 [Moniliophthora perniciosa]